MSRRILLVGAAGGIGRATAARLIAQNYDLIGTVYDAREAQDLRTALPGIGDVAIVDLSDAVEARKAFEALLGSQEGPLAAVIGCAGAAIFGPVEATRIEDLRDLMEVNVFANIAAYQAAMPYLRQSKGKVIVVSSYAGSLGFPLFSAYSATKHALEALLNVARLEAGQWDVSVSLIVPGGVKTGMTSNLPDKLYARLNQLSAAEAELYRAYFEQYVQLMTASAGAFADPDEVAKAILQAVLAERPAVRYIVGDDANLLVGQKKTLTDEAFDAFIRKMFPGSSQGVR